ncbi:MAG TPA: GAF domain-containing protein [Solirubrobacteraceae bacterium]|nr:GAF domain-containing protein [Solirubrobacteraceae bacterium]
MATPVAEERAAALLEIATLIAREAPDDLVFATVSEHVARQVGAEAAVVARYVGDERAVVVGSWREDGGRGFPVNAELDFDRTNSASGRVRSTGRPTRMDSYDDLGGELPLLMRAHDLRGTVAAPVLFGEEVWGVVAASTTRAQPLPAGSEHQIVAFADLVAVAIATAESRQRVHASRQRLVKASDETRRQLERALHEGAQQHLLALTLKLRLARGRTDDGSVIARLIDDALAEADVANATLRELARDLYPIVLSERGLAVAVQALAARAAVGVQLRELPKGRFPALAEATAYFVVAEALSCTRTDVAVTVSDRGNQLFVEVAPAEPLPALADRVAAVGGQLQTGSLPDGSTLLRAEIPV